MDTKKLLENASLTFNPNSRQSRNKSQNFEVINNIAKAKENVRYLGTVQA